MKYTESQASQLKLMFDETEVREKRNSANLMTSARFGLLLSDLQHGKVESSIAREYFSSLTLGR